jgi:hypothetical protein
MPISQLQYNSVPETRSAEAQAWLRPLSPGLTMMDDDFASPRFFFSVKIFRQKYLCPRCERTCGAAYSLPCEQYMYCTNALPSTVQSRQLIPAPIQEIAFETKYASVALPSLWNLWCCAAEPLWQGCTTVWFCQVATGGWVEVGGGGGGNLRFSALLAVSLLQF